MPAAKPPINLKISDGVLAGIEEHAYSNLSAEVGGMLMGSVKGKTTHIDGYIPALSASAEQVTLTFTHDVWEEILAKAAKEFPDKNIVGWYHTHPTFGIFLSDYDLFIQENFFANQGNVALVIDPVQGLFGWFGKDSAGTVSVFEEGATERGPKRSVDPLVAASESSGGRPWKTVIIGALAFIVGGALAGGVVASQIPPDLSGALQTSRQETADARNQAREMESVYQELLRQPVLAYQVQAGQTVNDVVTMFYDDFPWGRWAVTTVNNVDSSGTLPEGQWIWIPRPSKVAIEPISAPDFLSGYDTLPPRGLPPYATWPGPEDSANSEEQ